MVDKVELYDEFSGLYDLMVCWDNRLKNESTFFKDLFKQQHVKRVLDAGCGTGMHAILFADWGYEVIGTDLSGEMVKKAKENALKSASKASFIKAGFGQLRSKVQGEFDAVTCLGNSLPHLLTKDGLAQALRDIYSMLSNGGVFVTQNRNYDKVMAEKNRFMPLEAATLDDREILFFRLLDFCEDSIGFNIVTFTKDQGKWSYVVKSTKHRPILKDELETLLSEAGFTDLQFLGDYQGHAFDAAESVDLIVVGKKK